MAGWQTDTVYVPGSSFPSGPLFLPPELDIRSTVAPPVYNPLTMKQVKDDIILLAEFSEIEGPLPLLTIPRCQPSYLDLNDFVVKVMSTDYLNTSGEFRICADTQMVQQDIEPGIHVYVHYFTLYDVRARGFVRPMCLSYISSDPRKLLHYFMQLRALFTEATECLKLSNLKVFTREMQELIADLEYTKDRYIQIQRQFTVGMEPEGRQARTVSQGDIFSNTSVCSQEKDQNATQINDQATASITNFNGILDSQIPISDILQGSPEVNLLTSASGQSVGMTSLASLSCNLLDSEDNEEALLKHTSLEGVAMQLMECQHILDIVKPHLDKKDVEEDLERLTFHIRSKPQSPLHKAMCKLSMLEVSREQSKPTICVLSLMKRNFRDMRSVQLLCGVGYISCLIRLKSINERFSKPFLSLVFEDLDNGVHENPFGSLYIGNIPVINVDKLKCDVPSLKPKAYASLCWDDHFLEFLNRDESYQSTPDSEYSDALDIPKGGPDVYTAEDCLKAFPVVTSSCSGVIEQKDKSEEQSTKLVEVANSKSALTPESSLPYGNRDTSEHQGGIGGSQHSNSSSSSWSSQQQDLAGFEDIEEEEEVQEDVALALGEEPVSCIGISERMITSKVCRLSGLVQQFCGVSHCLVYSLLSGRPVVLAAADQYRSLVMLYVRALSTLLPRSPRQKLPVLRWHTGTITSFHIQHFRVVGLCIPERLHVQDLMSNSTLVRKDSFLKCMESRDQTDRFTYKYKNIYGLQKVFSCVIPQLYTLTVHIYF